MRCLIENPIYGKVMLESHFHIVKGRFRNSIRKELNNLYSAGYLNKEKRNNKIEYNANIEHPLFEVLQKIVIKHLGLEDIVESVLDKMGNIKSIVLIGDYAKGIDSGHIEIFLVGDDLNMSYISEIENKIEKLIKRKVNFYFAPKLKLNKEKIVLYESEE